MNKFLIVGLGNIGAEYVNTRHNIGFKALDFLAKQEKVEFEQNSFLNPFLLLEVRKALNLDFQDKERAEVIAQFMSSTIFADYEPTEGFANLHPQRYELRKEWEALHAAQSYSPALHQIIGDNLTAEPSKHNTELKPISSLDPDQKAAVEKAQYASEVIYGPPGTGKSVVLSNIIGQGRNNDVMKLIYRIMSLSFFSAVLMFLLFNVFAVELLSVFRLSKEFVDAAVPVLRIVTTGMLFMSVSVVWLNAVTGTGNTKMNLIIEAVTIVLYLIYIYVVLEVYQLSLMWAWASELIYWNSILLMAFFYIRSGKWKGKVI